MTPYRTPAPPPVPRRVPWYVCLLSSPASQWWRRAAGGAWELRAYLCVPGVPESWVPASTLSSLTYAVVAREVWS